MLHRFAHNQSILFWTLNTGGWVAYAVLNYLIGIEANNQPPNYLVPSLIYAAGGMTIGWGLRLLYRAVRELNPLLLLVIAGAATTLSAALFTGFRTLSFMLFYEPEFLDSLSFMDYFNLRDTFTSVYIIGTWSGLYFGIKFYQTVQRQNETLLKAASAANEAQLKVLRYQLNPHFLFNTLNSISTLVLERHNKDANRLVTRLSRFLRTSFDSDPKRKMALEKELETIRLYLEIEQARFEERLKVEFDVDKATRRALVPGLLLQPLIENAITHAISLSETGGTISIAAKIENGKLCLRVADSGPGKTTKERGESELSEGVGLKNTRERLEVLYGDRYDLNLETRRPGGLSATVCIPLEFKQ
ncbi:MAG: histidine kinase [Gammaproteobacteria bacterium]|nr:histidine kinase [Gammaproteobacteria bacterium]NNE05996.1 histidine kinase [Xanthomonadales bacterium]